MKKYKMPNGQVFTYERAAETDYQTLSFDSIKVENILQKKNKKKLLKEIKKILKSADKKFGLHSMESNGIDFIEFSISNHTIDVWGEKEFKIETKKEFKKRMKRMRKSMIKNAKEILRNA